jgi:hypothetical protein
MRSLLEKKLIRLKIPSPNEMKKWKLENQFSKSKRLSKIFFNV